MLNTAVAGCRGKVSKLGFGHMLAVKLNFVSVQGQIDWQYGAQPERIRIRFSEA